MKDKFQSWERTGSARFQRAFLRKLEMPSESGLAKQARRKPGAPSAFAEFTRGAANFSLLRSLLKVRSRGQQQTEVCCTSARISLIQPHWPEGGTQNKNIFLNAPGLSLRSDWSPLLFQRRLNRRFGQRSHDPVTCGVRMQPVIGQPGAHSPGLIGQVRVIIERGD